MVSFLPENVGSTLQFHKFPQFYSSVYLLSNPSYLGNDSAMMIHRRGPQLTKIFPGVCDAFLQDEKGLYVNLTYSSLCCPKLLSPCSNEVVSNKVHPPKSHVEKHPIPISCFPQRKHWKPTWTLHTQIRGASLPCPETRKDQMKSNSYL